MMISKKTPLRSVVTRLWPIYLAYLISQLGSWMFRASVVYEIYDKQSGSNILLGSTIFLIYIPIFIGGRFLAPYADRWDSKKILVGLDVLRAIVLLPLLFRSQLINLNSVYLALFTVVILSLSSPLFIAAQSAYIRRNIDKDNIVNSLAIVSNIDWITNLFGTVIGSILLLSISFSGVIIIDIITFIISTVVLLRFMPSNSYFHGKVLVENSGVKSVSENTKYSYYILWVIFFLNLGAGAINIYPNVVVRDVFNIGSGGLSYIYLGNGIGGFLGAFVVHRVKNLMTPIYLIALTCVLIAVSIFGMSIFSSISLAIISSSAMLFFGQIFAVVTNSYLLRTYPVDQAGRISGLFTAATFSGVAINALLFSALQSDVKIQSFSMFLVFCSLSAIFALVPLMLFYRRRQKELESVSNLA